MMSKLGILLIILDSMIREINGQVHQYQVFISPFYPLTKCEKPNSSLLLESTKTITQAQSKIISGYENIKNMKNDKYYTIQLQCVDQSELKQKLYDNPSTTDKTVIGIGGQKIQQDLIQQNIEPSMPIYQVGLKLVVQKNSTKTYWILFKPISIEVGLGYLAMGLVVSLVVWFMEEKQWKQPKRKHFHHILELLYDVFSSLFFTNLIHLQKVSSRIALWFFWFTTFVYISVYQAYLTLKVSESYEAIRLQSFRQGLEENHKYGILDSYYNQLKQFYPEYMSQFVQYPSSTSQDSITRMFTELDSNQLDGIVLETPLADYFCSLYCQSETVDEIIFSYNYVSLFAKDTSILKIQEYNRNLSKSKQTYPLSSIRSYVFDITGLSTCQKREEEITTSELAGAWIILSVTFGVTLIIWAIQKCLKIKQTAISNYYYQFQNEKNQYFENKLKKSIQSEVHEILTNYQENFMKQIEIFERNLMLQDIDDKEEKSSQNLSPLKRSAIQQFDEIQQDVQKRQPIKSNS